MKSVEAEQRGLDKILEKMFIYADNKDLNLNRIRNIVVNPQILRVLIHELDLMQTNDKIRALIRVVEVYKNNSLNPCILKKRDNEILEFNHSIFDEIIGFFMSIKLEFAKNLDFFEAVRPLISGYLISSRNIKNLIAKVSRNFHQENFSPQQLQLSLLILKQFYKSQVCNEASPKCFFYMYGPNSGLRPINQELKWTLAKGMYFYINFYMESYKHEEMNLLNLAVNNDSFELCVDEENYLTVKVFQGNKVNRLRKIQQKKWYFLKLAYCLRSGIIRNSYELIIYIEGEPYQLRDLPVPNITMKNSIEELLIGHQFYGKINFAAISRKQLHYWPKSGVNNWGQLEGVLAANKDSLKEIFIIYSPIACSKLGEDEIIYEISSKNHGEILENTAIHKNPFSQVDINYYGGLYTLLPFFYILKFYKYESYPTALQEMLNLLVTVFDCQFQNIENQAINCQLFGIIVQFINQIDQRFLTVQVIKQVENFRNILTLKPLKKQFLQSLLLKIRIDRIDNIQVITKIHQLILSYFYQQFDWSLQTISLYDIIWYIIDNFQPTRKDECCLLHYWEQTMENLEDQKVLHIGEFYKNKSAKVKELLKYVVKMLCNLRRFQVLQNPSHTDQGTIFANKKDKFNFFQYLKHDGYSICLKKMLLECITVGVLQDPQNLIKHTDLLPCLFGLLKTAQLRDQILPIAQVLNECSKSLVLIKDPKHLEIIRHLGIQLDKMYKKNYAFIKLRSKSDGLQFKKKFQEKRKAVDLEDSMSCVSELKCQAMEKQKDIKNKILKLKTERKAKISTDKEFYDIIMHICCTKEPESGDIILIDDDCTKVIYPYFKISCPKFQVKLIQIIRTTIMVKSKQDTNSPKMQSLAKFDQLYRFILSQFILKQLDPEGPSYKITEESTYIIKNFYYILDGMIISMKNNWDSLYTVILRLIGILTEAKKDLHVKTQRSKKQILMACKVCVRKFVLRVLKYAEKSIENMSNMVFLVYLVVFHNPEPIADQSENLFDYFSSLQKHFFIGPIQILDQDNHEIISRNMFVDQKIIFTYIDCFKIDEVFSKSIPQQNKKRRYTMNLIQAYLDKDEKNQLQDYLYKLRKVFLSKSKFKEISSQDSKGIRSMISKFIVNNQDSKAKQIASSYDLYVCQLIGLLLCLTVEETILTRRIPSLKQALDKYILFIKAFSLSCSRDNLTKKQHIYRNEKVPKNLVYHMFHFLYEMIERCQDELIKTQIRETLYELLNFLTLLMTVLSNKAGNPNTVDQLIVLSKVMQDVQFYNFFSFEVLKDVITLNEIKVFSTIDKSKALDVINHENMKEHFKQQPTVFLEKHIRQVVQIHEINIEKVEQELGDKFYQDQIKRKASQNQGIICYESNQFEEFRLDHARKLDFQYRQIMRVWRKIWKRLRLYHYYWSISMDQREEMKIEWKKFKYLPYKHKFGKYTHLDGLRPILQIQPNQPWHVRKSQLQQQFKYRNKNLMTNLYKLKTQKTLKQQSFLQRLLLRKSIKSQYFQVQWIKHNSKRKGRLSFNKQKLIFQYESTFQKDSHVDFTSFTLAQHRTIQKTWYFVSIYNIIRRRYLMKHQCLLIQFEDSSAVIFDFINDDCDVFLAKIQQIQQQKADVLSYMKANKVSFYLKNFRKSTYHDQIEEATQQWSQGKMTNLQYLMIINKYGGRSYLDPVNFPVMPWIITNYDFKELIYRDLSKTLGALGSSSRRQFYQSKVQAFDPFSEVPPYQYGTHYSSPGVLFNFFIRISPYTEAGRTLQGGRFDLSDRLFSSMKVCWHSVTHEVSDVRELNPQFFYLPEFLLNIDNYDFGLTQTKERVDNVKLPFWAVNPYEYITIHRRALENDEVSSGINAWIDLIFGYKQKGKLARENLNLYYYLTYEDSIDLKKIEDNVHKTSIEAQIIHFGQTPTQLFLRPHPQKKTLRNQKPFSEPQKVKFVGNIETISPLLILGEVDNNMLLMNESTLFTIQTTPTFQVKQEISILRGSSKEGLYFIEDISPYGKAVLFGNGKFLAVCSYINGDLVIYNLNGKKIHQKRGHPKTTMIVNSREDLLLCGCQNGLLEVFEIVYMEKQSVSLIKIVCEYYMFPIQDISEGAGFFSISAGNLVIINKITRGLNYIHDKIKMQGSKMIRSLQAKRNVQGSFICCNPIYCVVFYNPLQLFVYSINGQFLKLRQTQNLIKPIIMQDWMHRENLLILEPDGLLVLKIPELETVCSIHVPHKEYLGMKIVKDKIYLMTVNGQILYLFNQKQVMFY